MSVELGQRWPQPAALRGWHLPGWSQQGRQSPAARDRVLRWPAIARLTVVAIACALVAGYLALAIELLNARAGHQIQVTGHPFVISDLFPRWYGARALLGGRDPYSEELTADLQRLYYGKPMAPADEMRLFGTIVGFFYPPYVVVPLLPFLWLPFEVVRWLAAIGLGAALVASAWLWTSVLGSLRTKRARWAVAAFALLFLPSLDLLWLQQLTALVSLYLVAAYVLAARRRYAWAGIVLALAMIKPQLAAVPAAGLLFWSAWRRERWAMPAAFGATMVAQLALSESLVPGWIGHFREAAGRYQEFNRLLFWLPGLVTGSEVLGTALIVAPSLALLTWCWWRQRAEPAAAPAVLHTAGLTFVLGVVVMPDISFYNKTLLLAPMLTLAAAGRGSGAVRRATTSFAVLAVGTPVAMMGMAAWMRWLGIGVETVPVWFDLAQLLYLTLPLFLLPAVAALCLDCVAHRSRSMAGEVEPRLLPCART